MKKSPFSAFLIFFARPLILFLLIAGGNLTCLISFAQYPPPTITSFTPTSGPVGTTVKIIGTYFTGSLSSTIVFFGATKATVTAVSTNTITATVPAGATYQYISVTDISYPATAYSPKPFIVTFPCGGLIDGTSFAAKQDFTAGSAPNSIAVGDLDRDGKADIVVSNQSSNTVSVFRNTSTSTTISFATVQTYTTGAAPQCVALGDLNLDGKLDIAVTNFTPSTVSTFRNTSSVGSISFAAKVDFTTGLHPVGVAIHDLDADGLSDIAVANRDADNVSVLRNINTTTATITFAAKVDFAAGDGPNSIAVGDLEGDGEPDLAVVNGSDVTVSILRHTGTPGSMTFAQVLPDLPASAGCRSVAIGDLNMDGKPDFVVGNANTNPGSVSVFTNASTTTATITYSPKIDYATGTGLAGTQSATIGDVDGDGLPDIASANSHPAVTSVSVFKNTGAGFAAKVDFTTGPWPYAVAIADLNGDGKADLSAANNSGTSISCMKNLINVVPAMTNGNTATICSGDTVNLPFISNVPSTYIWNAADNVNTTGESTSSQINDTLTDIITNTTLSAQIITYTVTPTSLTGCAGIPQTITITVNPLPVVSYSGLAGNYCINASAQTLTGSPPGGTFSGAGISGNSFTPSVAASGTYTVMYTYTDGNGCTNTSSKITQVAPFPLTPAICLVTVDSASDYNIIVWEKPANGAIDSFIIYRDTANNNYAPIGKVPYDSLSQFVDTVRTLYTVNGDPNASSWRYKLAVKDTCGNISAMSPFHQTMFIQCNGGNFSWNHYQIEGQVQPVPALSQYLFDRDNANNGNYITLTTLSASSIAWTDPQYANYQSTANWKVKTQWSISCTPTIKYPQPMGINTSKSNNYKTTGPTFVNGISLENLVNVFPNPSTGKFQVLSLSAGETGSKLQIQDLGVYNMYGELVSPHVFPKVGESGFAVDLSSLSPGIYFIHIKTEHGTIVKKIIVAE